MGTTRKHIRHDTIRRRGHVTVPFEIERFPGILAGRNQSGGGVDIGNTARLRVLADDFKRQVVGIEPVFVEAPGVTSLVPLVGPDVNPVRIRDQDQRDPARVELGLDLVEITGGALELFADQALARLPAQEQQPVELQQLLLRQAPLFHIDDVGLGADAFFLQLLVLFPADDVFLLERPQHLLVELQPAGAIKGQPAPPRPLTVFIGDVEGLDIPLLVVAGLPLMPPVVLDVGQVQEQDHDVGLVFQMKILQVHPVINR